MWFNLRKFFTLAQISKKKVSNHYPEHLLFMWIVLRGVIWLGDLSQSYKLSEIKQPLIRIKEKTENAEISCRKKIPFFKHTA